MTGKPEIFERWWNAWKLRILQKRAMAELNNREQLRELLKQSLVLLESQAISQETRRSIELLKSKVERELGNPLVGDNRSEYTSA